MIMSRKRSIKKRFEWAGLKFLADRFFLADLQQLSSENANFNRGIGK